MHTENAPSRAARAIVIAVVLIAAVTARTAFLNFQSGDYRAFLLPWYQFIQQNGGLSALRYNFSDYNAPYLYLLVVLTHIPVSPLLGVKLISMVFDFLLGYFAYRIVALRHPDSWWPVLAGAAVVLLPTVVVNSSMWGQADAIYSAFGVGGVYFLLRKRPWSACVFFGLALGFKLQIVFLFPLLLLLVLRKHIPWPALLLIPGVYLALDIPALLIGADPHTLLTVYLAQTGSYSQLTLGAPNVYQFLDPNLTSSAIKTGGVVVTGLLALGLVVAAAAKRVELTTTRIVLAATLSVLLVPYLLPAMHERYFYLADVLTVMAACYLPLKLWALPVLTQFASLYSYLPFLTMRGGGGDTSIVDRKILAAVMLAALLLAGWAAVSSWRSSSPTGPVPAPRPTPLDRLRGPRTANSR
jgi:Gpi18-like mannosyltransferase